jgi:DNA-binding GntR family transcriptional regulator
MATVSKVEPLVDALRGRILAGEFDAGKLPSFRTLSAEYNTTQETMNKVMQSLQAEGLLVSQGTKGVFVNTARIRVPGIVVDFPQYLEKEGFKPRSEFIILPEVIDPPEEVRKGLKLKKGQKVLRRKRKQGTDTTLFRIATEYYPMDLINEDMMEKIKADPHFSIIIAIKENFGKTIQYAQEEIIGRFPTAFEQKELQLVRTNPIIESKSSNFAKDKITPILYYHKVLNANQFILTYDYSINYWE